VADDQFSEFVRTHGDTLLRLGYLLCGDGARAEDLVQDALVKLMRRWRVNPPDHPLAYARKTVVNEYLGWKRRRSSRELVGDELVDVTLSDESQAQADRDLVWRLLSGLSPRARAVLVLRYYAQLPDREIADHLGCAEATVRSVAARAFASLREHPQLSILEEA
jgi:RNA polymerase sigma-70 factor (sigma-E family)